MSKKRIAIFILTGLVLLTPASLFGQMFTNHYLPSGAAYQGAASEPVMSSPGLSPSRSLGASQGYMGTTTLPQSELYEPFGASAPSARGPLRAPGSGGTGKTDVDNPGLSMGNGIGVLMLLALAFAAFRYLQIRKKKSSLAKSVKKR